MYRHQKSCIVFEYWFRIWVSTFWTKLYVSSCCVCPIYRSILTVYISNNSRLYLCLSGMEWSESVCARLWKQRVNTQAGQAPEASAVGSKWTWPKESEVSQNDRPQQGNHRRPKIRTPQWKHTTTLQNGHISFIYLYPNKLTHIEYNLFFFCKGCFLIL